MKTLAFQILCAATLSIPNFLAGAAISWTSYATRLLASEQSPIGYSITKTDISWIGSILMLMSLVTSSVAGRLTDCIGRKKSELICGLGLVVSFALIAVAKNVTQIIIGRALFGLAYGIHMPISYIYMNEISQANIRGSMVTCMYFFFSIGCLTSYILGWFCSYNVINYTYLTVSVIFAVALNFLKDSPMYLMSKGKEKEALQSLKFYRATSENTAEILDEIDYIKQQTKRTDKKYNDIKDATSAESTKLNMEREDVGTEAEMSAFKMLYKSKSTMRALVTITTLTVLSILTGAIAIQSYAAHFFSMAAPDLSPHLCSVILALAIVAGCVLGTIITDMVSRRKLIMISSVICTTCLGILCSMLRWAWAPVWVIPAAMLVYTCSYQLGIHNLPLVQMSESFTPKVRGLASAIVMSSLNISTFLVVATFGYAVDFIGLEGVFLVFFLISVLYGVIAFVFVKETKGVNLEEIQEMYERGWCFWK